MPDTGLAAPWEQETPRETRSRLNQMERWLARTAHQHDQAHVLFLRSLFEVTYTPAHADYLTDELREIAAPAHV